jgi:hypothetical protein
MTSFSFYVSLFVYRMFHNCLSILMWCQTMRIFLRIPRRQSNKLSYRRSIFHWSIQAKTLSSNALMKFCTKIWDKHVYDVCFFFSFLFISSHTFRRRRRRQLKHWNSTNTSKQASWKYSQRMFIHRLVEKHVESIRSTN